jgi:hypothetical protein
MKSVTRLLFLTVLVIPILTVSKASAFGGPGLRDYLHQRERMGERGDFYHTGTIPTYHPLYGVHNGVDPLDPFKGNDDRNHLMERVPIHHPDGFGDPGGSGGGMAPLDGGISLLLAAGIGLGMKRARERKKSLIQKNVDISE